VGIWYFIAQDNPDAAIRVIEAAYETFKTLAARAFSSATPERFFEFMESPVFTLP